MKRRTARLKAPDNLEERFAPLSIQLSASASVTTSGGVPYASVDASWSINGNDPHIGMGA